LSCTIKPTKVDKRTRLKNCGFGRTAKVKTRAPIVKIANAKRLLATKLGHTQFAFLLPNENLFPLLTTAPVSLLHDNPVLGFVVMKQIYVRLWEISITPFFDRLPIAKGSLFAVPRTPRLVLR
jgi:hypothetical protein